MFINIQLFAHKKGVGSTKNGRDSEAKRLGVKKLTTTVTNKVVNGYKLCPHCGKRKDVNAGAFNRDKYQPNNWDYW